MPNWIHHFKDNFHTGIAIGIVFSVNKRLIMIKRIVIIYLKRWKYFARLIPSPASLSYHPNLKDHDDDHNDGGGDDNDDDDDNK